MVLPHVTKSCVHTPNPSLTLRASYFANGGSFAL